MSQVMEMNLWQYLHLEKNIAYPYFCFQFWTRTTENLGWEGLLEMICLPFGWKL